MPYNTSTTKPIRIDLSALGATAEGEPFYAVVHTWHTLPRTQLAALRDTYPEFFTHQPAQERAWQLLMSPAYAYVAAALVVDWNLTDMVTDTPLAIPPTDPAVVDQVPTAVWGAIWKAIAQSARSQPHNLVALSPRRH